MKTFLATILSVIGLSLSAQTTNVTATAPARTILWPPNPLSYGTSGFNFTIPSGAFTMTFPAQVFTVAVPLAAVQAQKPTTNYMVITNYVRVTNITYLTVTQTNVQPVWVTNIAPTYFPVIAVDKLNIKSGVVQAWSTNK